MTPNKDRTTAWASQHLPFFVITIDRRRPILAALKCAGHRDVASQQLLGLLVHPPSMPGRPGRQPYALTKMLRIDLLQHLDASDPAMDKTLHESPSRDICQAQAHDARHLGRGI
ncbi:hypothetical protein [Xanthomonas nasturtii]|uniref:hypothetical protein n=1 Tax=Xanthomonas nasturtii TaxID=1843581 RepID=UPI003D2F8D08